MPENIARAVLAEGKNLGLRLLKQGVSVRPPLPPHDSIDDLSRRLRLPEPQAKAAGQDPVLQYRCEVRAAAEVHMPIRLRGTEAEGEARCFQTGTFDPQVQSQRHGGIRFHEGKVWEQGHMAAPGHRNNRWCAEEVIGTNVIFAPVQVRQPGEVQGLAEPFQPASRCQPDMMHAPGQPNRCRNADSGLDQDSEFSVQADSGLDQRTIVGRCRHPAGQDKLVPFRLCAGPTASVALEIGTTFRSPDHLRTFADGPQLRPPNGYRSQCAGYGHVHPVATFIPDPKRQPLQTLGLPDVHAQVFIPYRYTVHRDLSPFVSADNSDVLKHSGPRSSQWLWQRTVEPIPV